MGGWFRGLAGNDAGMSSQWKPVRAQPFKPQQGVLIYPTAVESHDKFSGRIGTGSNLSVKKITLAI